MIKTTTDERGHYTYVVLKANNVYPLRGAFYRECLLH